MAVLDPANELVGLQRTQQNLWEHSRCHVLELAPQFSQAILKFSPGHYGSNKLSMLPRPNLCICLSFLHWVFRRLRACQLAFKPPSSHRAQKILRNLPSSSQLLAKASAVGIPKATSCKLFLSFWCEKVLHKGLCAPSGLVTGIGRPPIYVPVYYRYWGLYLQISVRLMSLGLDQFPRRRHQGRLAMSLRRVTMDGEHNALIPKICRLK